MKNFLVKPSALGGRIRIPGSKSHTIRALVCGMLSAEKSVIRHPLKSSDTLSALDMVRKMGASVVDKGDFWEITGGSLQKVGIVDVGNSGTALYFGMAVAAASESEFMFTGDEQIQRRPADKLLNSINDLGGFAISERGNGCAPAIIKGPMKGGRTSVEAVTSQYLSALLLAAPVAKGHFFIDVPLLNEKPYVEMTLAWLERCGIKYKNNDFKSFEIDGFQSYMPFDITVPADFSSASFFLVAAAITGSELFIEGLDYSDTQGDKEITKILSAMGAEVEILNNGIRIKGPLKNGGTFDLNSMPDALPILSVAACFSQGETRLINVAQARIKETDRIAVMCSELQKMGADIEELPDGLVIRGGELRGAKVLGHDDHRVIMALSVAGLVAGETLVEGADAVSVTFPEFFDILKSCGGDISEV